MGKNILKNKSFDFALRIVNLSKFLISENKEFVLSKQILRSGTSIGALISEAEYAESKNDFIHKFRIALKEANETRYWLDLLEKSEYIDIFLSESLKKDITELIKMLTSSINTSLKNK